MRDGRGKTAKDENFPVASILIAPALRPVVTAFYAFARQADDVADDPDLDPGAKARRLDAFEAALDGAPGPGAAATLRVRLAARGLSDRHARDLLVAFRRDAAGLHCADWPALLDYCAHSAHPVGRFLLDLHGEPRTLWDAADALCAALQILNHLQDLRADHDRLDRVYVPKDWLAAEGLDAAALGEGRASPALRRVIHRVLDACEPLVRRADGLAEGIAAPGLAGQAAATHRLARRLHDRLRAADPLARRVTLSRLDFAGAAFTGLVAFGLRRRRAQAPTAERPAH